MNAFRIVITLQSNCTLAPEATEEWKLGYTLALKPKHPSNRTSILNNS